VGPVEVAGYYRSLSKGFRALGCHCDFVTFEAHPFGYGGESKSPDLLAIAKKLDSLRSKSGRNFVLKTLLRVLGKLARLSWAVSAIFRYDAFIFGYGKSLLSSNWDLPLLHALRKTVIVNVGHGSELRPPYIDGSRRSKDGGHMPDLDLLRSGARQARRRIKFIEKYATYIVGAPFSSTHFASTTLINWFAIGVPCPGPAALVIGASSDVADSEMKGRRAIRVLHSPSHPAAKGSAAILMAIDRLRDKGYLIDYVEIINRPNEEVLAELQCCDFVIDQLYSDTPMAGFAAEAAGQGKPAVVGGYGFEYLANFIPTGMYPPSMACKPSGIEKAIESLIVDGGLRECLGSEAQGFVQGKWSPENVAGRYLRLIRGDVPEEWCLDPDAVEYLHGCGQAEDLSRENIRRLVSAYGVEALQVSHRPSLERAFLNFAGIAKA
jgi:hypothetical protein